ncbi:hypothetical protein B296_00041861 [Ensete ventricosum]|uniref:Uncharacterized protein n=1 Tax=Ensete ventricosum TaxID=4639 RepID=A0A426Z1D0_ENSVE|nr:hypothetical protein B296_00041861 [Ensete ventricosum]
MPDLSSLLLGSVGGCHRGCSAQGRFDSSHLPATSISAAMYWCVRCSISGSIAGGRSLKAMVGLGRALAKKFNSNSFVNRSNEDIEAGLRREYQTIRCQSWGCFAPDRKSSFATELVQQSGRLHGLPQPGVMVALPRVGSPGPCALVRPGSSQHKGGARLEGRNPRVRLGSRLLVRCSRVGLTAKSCKKVRSSGVPDVTSPMVKLVWLSNSPSPLRRGAGAFIVKATRHPYLRSLLRMLLTMPSYFIVASVVLTARRAACSLPLGSVGLALLTPVRSSYDR